MRICTEDGRIDIRIAELAYSATARCCWVPGCREHSYPILVSSERVAIPRVLGHKQLACVCCRQFIGWLSLVEVHCYSVSIFRDFQHLAIGNAAALLATFKPSEIQVCNIGKTHLAHRSGVRIDNNLLLRCMHRPHPQPKANNVTVRLHAPLLGLMFRFRQKDLRDDLGSALEEMQVKIPSGRPPPQLDVPRVRVRAGALCFKLLLSVGVEWECFLCRAVSACVPK